MFSNGDFIDKIYYYITLPSCKAIFSSFFIKWSVSEFLCSAASRTESLKLTGSKEWFFCESDI